MIRMTTLFPPYLAIRKAPANLTAADAHLFQNALTYEIKEVKMLSLENAWLLKDTLFTFFPPKFYLRYTHVWGLPAKSLLKRLFLLLSPGQKIEKALWISDDWSEGFFHWFADALPRLIAIRELAKDHVVVLPKHFEKYDYIQTSLKIINCKTFFFTGKLRVKQLVVPGHLAPTGNYNKNVLLSIRDTILKQGVIPHKNIFVSRKKATRRKIKNEEQLLTVLTKYNFEIHYFEDYDFTQQLAVMAQAKILAGLHGAGLTNMLFMPQNGNVLELRNRKDVVNNCYFSMASDLGHKYYYLQNESNNTVTQDADITVNPGELDYVLKAMLG